jgi:hypothetical protein
MTTSLQGYSVRLMRRNAEADDRKLGVKLGRFCIERDLSVNDVAAELQVSKQAVYNWFCGDNLPHKRYHAAIEALLASAR